MICGIVGCERITAEPGNIGDMYVEELNWGPGLRLNLNSQLVLLGLRRLLTRLQCGPGTSLNLESTALIAGSPLSSVSSYERFDDSLIAKSPSPLICAQALPSVPVTAASICFKLTGITITLTGDRSVGIAAFRHAVTTLAFGRAHLAIAGCWNLPSTTSSRGTRDAQLSLVALQSLNPATAPGHDEGISWTSADASEEATCVDVFDDWLTSNAGRFELPKNMSVERYQQAGIPS